MADDSANIPQSDQEKSVLGWLDECLEEGEAFLKAQENYDKIAPAIDMINGRQRDLRPTTLSSTQYNYAGKCAGDLAALLTDTKPFWEYRTANQRYSDFEANLGKLATHWWLYRHQDLRLMDVIKYAMAGGSSYANIDFNRQLSGGGDLEMTGEDPRDVIPIRPNGNESVQNALGGMLRRPRTVNYLKQKYPSKAHLIVPDSDSGGVSLTLNSTRAGRVLEQLGGSPFLDRLWGRKPAQELKRIPSASCYTVYLHDDSINETNDTILMGPWQKNADGKWESLENWCYEVQPGEMKYPRGRQIIATRTAVLKDRPNPFWHGLIPWPKFTLDPWPWTYLGKAPLWDLISLQRSLDKDMRIVDDHLDKWARPDVLADKNSISKQALNKIDTRRAGGKYMHNPLAGKGMQFLYPEALDAIVQWHVGFLCDGMDKLSGVAAMQSLLQLQQIPSAETMDKVIQTMSPGIRARSRVLEAFIGEIAIIMAFNFAQFYTLAMRLMVLGPQGITREDFDFDPKSIIPDFVHSEDFDEKGIPTHEALARGPRPRFERAQEFMKGFTFHVAPGSLLSAVGIEQQLKYLQLARAGLVDHWTLLTVLNIPNVGAPPDGANTITERLLAEQQMGLGMAVSATGRKSSGQTMPRQVVKETK